MSFVQLVFYIKTKAVQLFEQKTLISILTKVPTNSTFVIMRKRITAGYRQVYTLPPILGTMLVTLDDSQISDLSLTFFDSIARVPTYHRDQ